jgi:hypothetical protein
MSGPIAKAHRGLIRLKLPPKAEWRTDDTMSVALRAHMVTYRTSDLLGNGMCMRMHAVIMHKWSAKLAICCSHLSLHSKLIMRR